MDIVEAPKTAESTIREVLIAVGVLVLTALAYGSIFNRETALSYSIGYNLYGAERILDGEVPYRDFHTLYPPATVYLNAVLFKWFGISLYTALSGVLIFKILTGFVLYLCARLLMPTPWAVVAWLVSLLWLRPNGPFKAVPMHYGALFLAVALCALLRSESRDRFRVLLLAGVALGLLALFKHNIGAYALIGAGLFASFDQTESGWKFAPASSALKRVLLIAAGCAIVVLPVAVYLLSQRALEPMIKTLLFGPGEFLVARLGSAPSPVVALFAVFFASTLVLVARELRVNRTAAAAFWVFAFGVLVLLILLPRQSLVDDLLFYIPAIVIGLSLCASFFGRKLRLAGQGQLFLAAAFAAAAWMEAFPRFAREQVIAAMPFVTVNMIYLLFEFKDRIRRLIGGWQIWPALAIPAAALTLIAGRLLFITYFDSSLRPRSETVPAIERASRVYFPRGTAEEITEVVNYLQRRIPEGGYFFAHSYAGSSYLFLADRRNPSEAQFWGGVGVTDEEKARTIGALERMEIEIIITSHKDLAAEQFAPMRSFIEVNYEPVNQIGDVLILEYKRR